MAGWKVMNVATAATRQKREIQYRIPGDRNLAQPAFFLSEVFFLHVGWLTDGFFRLRISMV
jgi:hypothetical protein